MTIDRNCPVCDHQYSKVLYTPKPSPGPVSKCQNCGMVFVSKIEDDHAIIFEGPVTYDKTDPKICTSANLDDIKDCWEYRHLTHKKREYAFLRQNAFDALKRIELHIGNNWTENKILDFGSGWGFFLAAAKEQGWDTFGIEPLVSESVYARATFGLNIITDTLRKNTFPPNFFDAITSFQVFETVARSERRYSASL